MDKLAMKSKVLKGLMDALDEDILSDLKKGKGEVKVMKIEMEPKEKEYEMEKEEMPEMMSEDSEPMEEEEDDDFKELADLRKKYRGE